MKIFMATRAAASSALPILIILGVHGSARALSFDIVWQLPSDGGFSSPNCLCDRATGKTLALVSCEKNSGVVCVGLDGKRRWGHPLTPPVTAAPAVADLDGDGAEEIVAADSRGVVAVLRNDGKRIWKAQLGGAVAAASCPAVADVDGDGLPEILVGDTGGNLSCLDNTGRLRWRFTGDGTQMGPVMVADIYDTPGKEIIVTSHDGCIYALSARGEWLWDLYFPTDLFPNSTPILADLDGDKTPELYVGGGLHHFYRIDLANPSVAFEKNVYMHINGAINAADLDRDGRDEVVFGTKAGVLWAYGHDGFRWKRENGRDTYHSGPIFLALDGGERMAAVFFGLEGSVCALDAAGTVIARADKLPCHPCGAPLAGDLDNDGRAEAVVTSTDTSGGAPGMFWMKLNVPFCDDSRNRLVFAQDRAHSGRAPRAASYKLLAAPSCQRTAAGKAAVAGFGETLLFSGPNTWRFDVENPSLQRLLLLVELQEPGGAVHRSGRHVRAARERAVFCLPVEAPGAYGVTRRLLDADHRVELASAKTDIPFAGIETDRAYLEKEFRNIAARAEAWSATGAGCARYVRKELAAQRGMLRELCVHDTPDRTALVAGLREEAVRLNALATVGQALAPAGSFIAWEFCPWAYFDPRATLPSPERKTGRLRLTLCQGEYGSLALNMTNVTGRTLDVRVQCGSLKRQGAESRSETPSASHVVFRKAVIVPTIARERVADALPGLDEGNTLAVSPWETQQLWLTVNAVNLAPGQYVADVRLKSIEPDPAEVHLPLDLIVYDLAMPRPRPLRLCNWVYCGGDLATGDDAVLRDLVEHGETVFLAPSPAATCRADGQLAGEIDFGQLDKAVKRLSPHGILLFSSPQQGLTGQPFLSEPWGKAFVSYVRAWSAHMKEMGVGHERWALYPYDEPSSPFAETTRSLVEVAKRIREADPRILVYADPTSGTTMETVAMLTGLVDIWQPSAELLERLGPELIPEAKRIGKEVWFYDAAGNAKTLSCLGIYRWRFWYAWQQGLTGVGWWVYSQHGNAERWDGPNPTGEFYASVYESPKGPVTSKRWEVAREGVQDYERLYLLRQTLREAESRGVADAELAEAKRLLKQLPDQIEAVLLNVGRRLPLTPDSVPLYEQATKAVEDARRQVAEACLRLKPATGHAGTGRAESKR